VISLLTLATGDYSPTLRKSHNLVDIYTRLPDYFNAYNLYVFGK